MIVGVSRREFVAWGTAAVAAVALGRANAAAEPAKTRLILLGTGGGPRPRTVHGPASQVIIVRGTAYVIDCGDGVARQLAAARVPLASIRAVFVTHQHSDHTADYGNLIWLAWASGLRTRVDTYGPPPLARMTALFFEMNAADIETRTADEGRVPLAPLVHVHEVVHGGPVMKDEHVKVTAAVVHHPPVVPSLGYRFDTPDRSIVISGDTTPSENLIQLARGADVLVHDALYVPGVDRIAARVPNAAKLKQSIQSHHTTAEDAGRVAQAAGVRMLVLSHLVPPDDPEISDEMWATAARKHFTGRVVVGQDLMEL